MLDQELEKAFNDQTGVESTADELAPKTGDDKAGDRTRRVDEETKVEAHRQNRAFIERKAEKFPQVIEGHKEVLKALLEKAGSQESMTAEEMDRFLREPPVGKGVEDADVRSVIVKAMEKVQPIVDMPQALERLTDLISVEQTQLWINENADNMQWYKTPEGQTTLKGIRADVEARMEPVE